MHFIETVRNSDSHIQRTLLCSGLKSSETLKNKKKSRGIVKQSLSVLK